MDEKGSDWSNLFTVVIWVGSPVLVSPEKLKREKELVCRLGDVQDYRE